MMDSLDQPEQETDLAEWSERTQVTLKLFNIISQVTKKACMTICNVLCERVFSAYLLYLCPVALDHLTKSCIHYILHTTYLLGAFPSPTTLLYSILHKRLCFTCVLSNLAVFLLQLRKYSTWNKKYITWYVSFPSLLKGLYRNMNKT